MHYSAFTTFLDTSQFMPNRLFFFRLSLVTLLAAAGLGLLHLLVIPARVHGGFAVACIALFFSVCTALFYAGKSAAQSSSKMAFNNLISVSVFGKMVLAILFLFIYQKSSMPPNQWFVGIFLWCYITYTVYEVWFMMQLARLR